MSTSLGDIISAFRKDQGLQAKFVALTASIPASIYSRIENGKRTPNDIEIVAIAKALQVDHKTIIQEWALNLDEKSITAEKRHS